jgi:hypothetical protein
MTMSTETTPEVPSSPPKNRLERRTIKSPEGREYAFDFLVIDSVEKWLIAEETKGEFHLPLNDGRVMRLRMSGINLRDWNEIEEKYVLPEREGNEDEATFKRKHDSVQILKELAILEKAIGQKIPGETDDDRLTFMANKNEADLESMFNFITNSLCAMTDGSMVDSYETVSRVAKQEVVEFAGFDDWQAASETRHVFRMQRPGDEFIIEFPFRGIDMKTRQRIDEQTKMPDAPQIPMRDPVTKKLIQGQMTSNLKDPVWRKQCRSVNQKRIVLYFEACLPFEIPGANEYEKYDWISRRLLGDVVRAKTFIEQQILDYTGRYDFFTGGHGLLS